MTRLSKADIQRTVDLYRQYGTLALVAARLGKSTYAVYRRLEIAGVKRDGRERRNGRPSVSQSVLSDTAALYRELGSMKAVALRLGVSEACVADRLKKAGQPIDHTPSRSRKRHRHPVWSPSDIFTPGDAR